MSSKYDDIIDLPHHVSRTHPRMPLIKRAAQFAPFAALSGHSSMIRDMAARISPQEGTVEHSHEMLNVKLSMLQERIKDKPVAMITYLVQDKSKDCGKYHKEKVTVAKVDEAHGELISDEGKAISFSCIADIESDIFLDMNNS